LEFVEMRACQVDLEIREIKEAWEIPVRLDLSARLAFRDLEE